MKETKLVGVKLRCRLLSHDVEELISTTCRGIDDKYFNISTEQGNVVTSGKTLSELKEEAGNPQRLKNLDITVIDFNLDRQVHIGINDKGAFSQVKGIDSTWVNGRFAELDSILRRTRSHVYWIYCVLANISTLTLIGFALAFQFEFFAQSVPLLIGADISTFCLAAALWVLTIQASKSRILCKMLAVLHGIRFSS